MQQMLLLDRAGKFIVKFVPDAMAQLDLKKLAITSNTQGA